MMTDKAISFIRYDKDDRIAEIFTDADPTVVQSVYDALKNDASHTFASGTFTGVRVRFARIYKKCAVSNYLNNNTTKIRTFSPAPADNDQFGSGELVVASVKIYDVTLTPCANTTTPTNIFEVTIPADDWGDGEKITVDVILTGTNNLATLTLDLSYGSDTVSEINNGNNANAGDTQRVALELWRVGSSVYIVTGSDAGNNTSSPLTFRNLGTYNSYGGNPAIGVILTPVTFNTEKDLVITATFDAADPGDTIEILAAKVVKM